MECARHLSVFPNRALSDALALTLAPEIRTALELSIDRIRLVT